MVYGWLGVSTIGHARTLRGPQPPTVTGSPLLGTLRGPSRRWRLGSPLRFLVGILHPYTLAISGHFLANSHF